MADGQILDCVMKGLQTLLGYLFDIFIIYLKFGIITLVFYFVAEWYIMRSVDELIEPAPVVKSVNNSTAHKIFRLFLDFFIG